MTLKQRLEKLEGALPEMDGGVRIVCNSIVRRDEEGLLWEKPFSAVLVRLPAAPNETLQRHEAEEQAAFIERVRDAIRRIDPAEAEAFRWDHQPGTDWTE